MAKQEIKNKAHITLKLTSTAFKLPKWDVISDDISFKKIQVCLEFLAKVVNQQCKENVESVKIPALRIYIFLPHTQLSHNKFFLNLVSEAFIF